jgi:hypothetical protein
LCRRKRQHEIDVGAGHEGFIPRTGYYQHLDIRVLSDLIHRLRDLLQCPGIEGVQIFRPVDVQNGDVVFSFQYQVFI